MKFAPLPVPIRKTVLGGDLFSDRQMRVFAVDSLYSNGYMLTPDNVIDVSLPAAGWAGAYTLRQMHGYAEDFYAANKDTKFTKPMLSSSAVH